MEDQRECERKSEKRQKLVEIEKIAARLVADEGELRIVINAASDLDDEGQEEMV